ncbi:MAG: Holliday junction branch migration protein RuvA [Rhodospirillales bacterium]
MIGKLSGRVDAVDETTALIDVGGVGYIATCSARTLAALSVDAPATLLIETSVREDAITLFGFADAGERQLFRLLLTVQGVGPKAALAILGALGTDALVTAIALGDKAAIVRAPGVGPKLAARITGELADRIGALAVPAVTAPPAGAAPRVTPLSAAATGDAVSALVNLGFRAIDAHAAVGRVAGRLGEGAAVEALIRGGLAELTATPAGPPVSKEANG